jgi:hypothetical protein
MQNLNDQNITDYLLANPELISVKRATENLVKRVRLRTPVGAAEYLQVARFDADKQSGLYAGRVHLAVEICSLYRGLFPREYAASQAPPFSIAREHEFYRLVNLRMFPIEMKQIDEDPDFFWPGIPLISKQPHDWETCKFEHLETVYRLVLILCEHRKPGKWRTFGLEKEPAPPLTRIPWSLFVYACRTEESPLRFLPFAFYLMHYQTGNPWFDVPDEGFLGIKWEAGNIARLYAHRAKATQLLRDINECSRWLDESPANAKRAVHLWNEAAKMGQAYEA